MLPPPGYLQDLRRLCTDTGTVLIFDEVQTGTGRTGTFYAFENEGVVPDVVTLAKGLAGGVPIGAMLANEEVGRGFEPGTHASTFGGNPLATAAALYVQRAIDAENLLERCRDVGAHLGSALLRLAERRRPKTRGARGRGLLQGLIVDGEPRAIVASRARARAAGVGGRQQRDPLRAAADRQPGRDRSGDRDPRRGARGGLRRREAAKMSEPQAFSQLLGPARRRHRGADPPRRGVPPAALAARAARHAARARAGHGLREGVDAHARQLRDRDVRARRPRAVPADAGLAAGARRADPRHRARAVGLLPRDDDPDVRARTRRRAGRVLVGAGDQRAHRSAAPLPGAGGSADRRAAVRRRRRSRGCRRCARCATPGSATATTWPTRGSRRRGSSASTWRWLVRPDMRPTPASSRARVRPSAGASRSTTTPAEAAAGRQVISTDVFASMGQEAEAETRLKTFAGFTIDAR